MRSNRTKLTLGMHARLLAQHLLQEALHTVHDPKPVASDILAAQGPQTASAAWESTGRYSLECLLQAPVLQQLCLGRCAGVPGFKCALQWPACNVRRQTNLAKRGSGICIGMAGLLAQPGHGWWAQTCTQHFYGDCVRLQQPDMLMRTC